MRAMVMREFGEPEVNRLEVIPVPQPGPGELLVRVGAVSVNRSFDIKTRENGNGRPRITFPLVQGADPSGVVVALGPETRTFAVGDRVAVWRAQTCGACERCLNGDSDNCLHKSMVGIQRWGGNAEYVALPESCVERVPGDLPYAEATVIIRHFPTALALAMDRGGLQAGESVLVMGAAGALGQALIQVCTWAGARVIAGAGADDRVQAALDVGADAGVNYRRDDLAAAAKAFTPNGRGVDLVLENIADPTLFPAAFDSLRYEGRLATVGSHGGGTVPLNVRRLYNQHLSVLGGATAKRHHVVQALEGAAGGHFKAVIGATLPLEELPRAHRLADDRSLVGKVIIDPNGLAST